MAMTFKEFKENHKITTKNHQEYFVENGKDFILDSYDTGYDDGYKEGVRDACFNIASLIYEQWEVFVNVCREYENLSEIEWIDKMIEFFDA